MQATPKQKAQLESMLALVRLSATEAQVQDVRSEQQTVVSHDAGSWFAELCDAPGLVPDQPMAIVPFRRSSPDDWAEIPDFSCLQGSSDEEPEQASWWDGGLLDPRDAALVCAAAAAPPLDPSFHGISKRAKGQGNKGHVRQVFCLNSHAPARRLSKRTPLNVCVCEIPCDMCLFVSGPTNPRSGERLQ